MLSVHKSANTPRGPSLSAALRSSDDKISVVSVEDIGLTKEEVGVAGSPTIVSRVLNVVIERPPVVLFNEGSAKERVSQLLQAINTKEEAN